MTVGFMSLAVLSCSKGDNQIEYQKPVEFRGYTAQSVTKADGSFVTRNELPAGQSFGVYAYNTGWSQTFNPSADSVSSYGKFMTDVQVTYNGGGSSSPENYPYVYRYWPNSKESNRLAFFAYYPYNGKDITRTGFADFTFTVQDNPADQIDFMLSDVVDNQMYGAAGSAHTSVDVVDLKFYHMLTQVRFKGITDAPTGATVKIKELKVLNLLNKGTLAPNVAATSSVWTPDETSIADYNITLKDMALPSNHDDSSVKAATIAEDNQTLLLLPQTLTGNTKLSIKYEIKTTKPNRTITETAEFVLNTAKDASNNPITKWERNNQIVYTLNIGLHPIEISASAEDWTDGGDDTIIIE